MKTDAVFFYKRVIILTLSLFSFWIDGRIYAQKVEHRNAVYVEYQLLMERYEGKNEIEVTTLSIIYERRIRILPTIRINVKTGLGFLPGDGADVYLFHLGTVALIGKKNHFGEVGLGRFYAFEIYDKRLHIAGFLFEPSAGYRFESKKGWILKAGFRWNLDGDIDVEYFTPYWGIGKAF